MHWVSYKWGYMGECLKWFIRICCIDSEITIVAFRLFLVRVSWNICFVSILFFLGGIAVFSLFSKGENKNGIPSPLYLRPCRYGLLIVAVQVWSISVMFSVWDRRQPCLGSVACPDAVTAPHSDSPARRKKYWTCAVQAVSTFSNIRHNVVH
jgi:hypothetical protein